MKIKRILVILLSVLTLLGVTVTSMAENESKETEFVTLMPELGDKTKKDGSLTIDYSNSSEGYIIAKAKPNKKKLKLMVEYDGKSIHYDLNGSGDYEVFPLQYGNGEYVFSLYENKEGKSYKKIGSVTLNVTMPDPYRTFLYPNQYINYTPETPAVLYAQEICKNIADPEEMVAEIFKFFWDFEYTPVLDRSGNPKCDNDGNPIYNAELIQNIKFYNINSTSLPEIDKAFETRKGVCKDFAGLLTAMLRSVGIPAAYCISSGGASSGSYSMSNPHADVIYIINGELKEADPLEGGFGGKVYEDTIAEYATRWY